MPRFIEEFYTCSDTNLSGVRWRFASAEVPFCRGMRRQKQLAGNNPNVAAVHEVDPENHWVFFPDHQERIAGALGEAIPKEVLQRALRDWVAGLESAHRENYIHAAITPSAQLLSTEESGGQITGGLWIKPDEPVPPATGEDRIFQAPELVRGSLTTAVDVYSLGASVLALAYGRGFAGAVGFPADSDAADRAALDQSRLAVPNALVGQLGSLGQILVRMIDPTPSSRPTLAQVRAELTPKRPWRPAVLIGTAVLLVLLFGVGAIVAGRSHFTSEQDSPGPEPKEPQVTFVRGELKVADARRPRLPGELDGLAVQIVRADVPAEARRIRGEIAGVQGEKETHTWSAGAIGKELPKAVLAAVKKWGVPLTLTLGVGTETRVPHPDDRVTLRIGFRLPPGVVYPADVADARDSTGRWFATAVRTADQARISVFSDPDGAGWWFVDQGTVTVRQYLDSFLPASEPFLRKAAQNIGDVPETIATAAGLKRDPLAGQEPIVPREPGRWAALVRRGPRLYDPNLPSHHKPYRGYPAPTERDVAPININLDELPGKTTDSLPIIGISWVEADAYRLWANKDGASWQIGPPRLTKVLPSSAISPAPVPRPATHTAGLGAAGLFFPFGIGNVLEFGPYDPTLRTAAVFGLAFSERASPPEKPLQLDPYERPYDISFRLALFQEDKR